MWWLLLRQKKISLEAKLRSLRNDYAKAIDDCAASRDKLKKFEAEVQSKANSGDYGAVASEVHAVNVTVTLDKSVKSLKMAVHINFKENTSGGDDKAKDTIE